MAAIEINSMPVITCDLFHGCILSPFVLEFPCVPMVSSYFHGFLVFPWFLCVSMVSSCFHAFLVFPWFPCFLCFDTFLEFSFPFCSFFPVISLCCHHFLLLPWFHSFAFLHHLCIVFPWCPSVSMAAFYFRR